VHSGILTYLLFPFPPRCASASASSSSTDYLSICHAGYEHQRVSRHRLRAKPERRIESQQGFETSKQLQEQDGDHTAHTATTATPPPPEFNPVQKPHLIPGLSPECHIIPSPSTGCATDQIPEEGAYYSYICCRPVYPVRHFRLAGPGPGPGPNQVQVTRIASQAPLLFPFRPFSFPTTRLFSTNRKGVLEFTRRISPQRPLTSAIPRKFPI
jgi:hypothetical protein